MAIASMTLPTAPLALQAVSPDAAIVYNALDLRYLIGAAYPRSGRLGLPDALTLLPRQAGANWSVDVQAGQAIFSPTGGNYYAPERYLVTLATRTNISLTTFNTAPAATRTHKVFLTVDDKNYAPGNAYTSRLLVTEDTGSGAANPTDAQMYWQLGTVVIAPSQSNIAAANLASIMRRADSSTAVTALTYYSGFSASTVTANYVLGGSTVRLQGSVQRTSGNFVAGTVYTVAQNLPKPAATRFLTGMSNGPTIARITVTTAGDLTVTPYAGNATDMANVYLDGLSYEID